MEERGKVEEPFREEDLSFLYSSPQDNHWQTSMAVVPVTPAVQPPSRCRFEHAWKSGSFLKKLLFFLQTKTFKMTIFID
jgi:hypothetical protein